MKLMQVDSGYFCAAIEFADNGNCIVAAPILKWCVGKNYNYLVSYLYKKKWKVLEKTI